MKKHTVQANGDVLATAVEKRMLELGMFPMTHFYIKNIIYFAYIVKNIIRVNSVGRVFSKSSHDIIFGLFMGYFVPKEFDVGISFFVT